jgi:hypothetical protein
MLRLLSRAGDFFGGCQDHPESRAAMTETNCHDPHARGEAHSAMARRISLTGIMRSEKKSRG